MMALIFYVSSLSDPGLPPGAMSDKTAHFLVYGALGGALMRALAGGRSARMTALCVGAAMLFATLYGISDEIHQAFVPLRTPDWRDVVADALGALTGAVAVALGAKALHLARTARSAHT
jgi:VanZ family protein